MVIWFFLKTVATMVLDFLCIVLPFAPEQMVPRSETEVHKPLGRNRSSTLTKASSCSVIYHQKKPKSDLGKQHSFNKKYSLDNSGCFITFDDYRERREQIRRSLNLESADSNDDTFWKGITNRYSPQHLIMKQQNNMH